MCATQYLFCRVFFTYCWIQIIEGYSAPYAREKLKSAQIIPEVISEAPNVGIEIAYSEATRVDFGSQMTFDVVNVPPRVVKWPADESSLYTLIMTDPDVPCRKYPTQREWLHWLIANIPGNDLAKGETVCNYVGPQRIVGEGRFVFLVYKQPDDRPKNYKEMKLEGSLHRLCWSVRGFAKNHSLGDPVAMNFFIIPEDPLEKEKEKERKMRIKMNKLRPPTLTTPSTTASYRDISLHP